ncbi:MAG: hypothetical protein ACI4EA_00740 [Candidatus Ornithomonoglobus sp.]
MINDSSYNAETVSQEEWAHAKCDKYDFMIAAFCGGIAGLIDVFFVGDPLTSKLGKSVDKIADGLVKKAAQMFWNNDKRTSGKNKKMPQTLEQCISYLEQAFPVNYDARYASDLNVEDGVLSGMRPLNHHLLSLAHSPDPIGLIFSIIDQFMGYATFVDKGKIIHVVPKKTSGAIPYMQGTNLPSMLFCGFVNWLGHIMSDLAGSSSTRKAGKPGRGAGIPMPFYELFLACDFGNIDGNTLSETMIKVFEEGYDLRFGLTMAIPVIVEELMIKIIWMIRQKFIRKKSWKESFPSMRHADLRIMLIVGNGTLCAVDGVDAAAHGLVEGGNVISFICHLNLVGWSRLVMLVLKELAIRFGPVINKVINKLFDSFLDILTPAEKERIRAFKARLDEYDRCLAVLFNEFVKQIEKEYEELYLEIHETFNDNNSAQERAEHSVRLAEIAGVEDKKIIRSHSQLDDLFL